MKLIKKLLKIFIFKFNLSVIRIGPYKYFYFENYLSRYYSLNKKLSFIQIGANDGKSNDPLFNFLSKNSKNINGHFFEPDIYFFKKLLKNYNNNKFFNFHNLAIHKSKTQMDLYKINENLYNKYPKYLRGIGSFSKDHLYKSSYKVKENDIVKMSVNCVNINDFIINKSIYDLDLLIIDTEV